MAGSANGTLTATGTPAGFDELANSHVNLVDVYFGGKKIAETLAVTQPGSLKFRFPGDLLAKVPGIDANQELLSAFAGDLPTNSQDVCSQSNEGNCGLLSPERIGIIYDEDHFRVDVFINPKFLRAARADSDDYLPTPDASLSLTNSLGLNASGSIGGSSAYNFQNRTIVGFRNARIRANTSLATDLGLVVDDFVGELDHKNLRYSAGLFWAPGSEFIGQRRIIGAGVGTQFDTWVDREELRGTPLIVFLAQPARVEILVDGRLISSGSYPAGNIDVDTSALPEGSYSVLLRIHEPNGGVREERRFFVKNAQVAPLGHPIFYAYAGLLANTRRYQPISPSSTLYYQAGTAWRLNNNFALDVATLGTQHKAIVQGGGWFIKGLLRLRVAGLVSTAGDAGGLLQMSTGGHGLLNVNFDVRRIWSHDGKPLIPLPTYANTFDVIPPTGVQLANGSYTQATGSIGLRLGNGYVSVVGSYRKDRNFRADYTIGPSINWPIVTRNQLQVMLEASAQRTRTTTAGFAGLRVLFTSGRLSMLNTIGHSYQNNRDEPRSTMSRAVTNFTAQYSSGTEEGTLLNLEGGLDRNISASTIHAGGGLDSRFGNLRGDLLHNLEGNGGTQYDVAFQSGVAFGAHVAALGARHTEESAVLVTVSGDASDAVFNVLVDEVPRGKVRVGQRLSLYVQAYRTYNVRIVPTSAVPVSYDTAARQVTVYPGNVQALAWRAESYFTIFGQATSINGAPISNALVQTVKGIAQTDANGYFQIDVRRDDPIMIAKADGPACHVRLGNVLIRNDFASVGKVICQ
jgi:Mat/Ecp fimbriae outer membrane usher protein